MVKSRTYQQFLLLLWKNFILKRRRPLATLLEIILPLIMVIILVLVRSVELKYGMDRCYLREKQMDSMGPIPFVRDFMCNFNTSCYNLTQINWNSSNNGENNLLTFLKNMTNVYNSFPNGDITQELLIRWMKSSTKEIITLKHSMEWYGEVYPPLMRYLEMSRSENIDEKKEGINGVAWYMCGSKENDVHTLFAILLMANLGPENNSSREKRASLTCSRGIFDTMGIGMFEILAPIILGKIYYTPVSNFTKDIIFRANRSYVLLDKLRLSSIEWRLSFKDWLLDFLITGKKPSALRSISESCRNLPGMVELCTLINDALNVTTLNASITSITSLFASIEYILDCLELDKFVPVPSEASIDNLTSGSMMHVYAGLIFDPSFLYLTPKNATLLQYTIRMPTNRIDSTKNFMVLDSFWTPEVRIGTMHAMNYYVSGFMMLQEALDHAFISLVSGNEAIEVGSSIQIMPSPCYVDDIFIRTGSMLMPLLFVISWCTIFSSLVKSIVEEKEKRLKEFMLIMGLSPFVHWMAWLTVAIVMTFIPSILMTLIIKFGRILEFSSSFVILLLFFSYSISFISQAFMLSSFFGKANVAAVVSGLGYFMFYVPYVVIANMEGDLTETTYYLLGLLCQVSFCNGIAFIISWEQAKKGAQIGTLFQSTDINLYFTVGHCIIMLWVDSLIYLLVTWYVEAVFPGEFGIPKPWCFFATKKYWLPNSQIHHRGDVPPGDTIEMLDKESDMNIYIEDVPEDLVIGISIQKLTKKFPTNSVPSVDNLNLDFYKSQITAFLGHNGAGKTTTISMLTGIYPPTSGTALVFGDDIRIDMDKIREVVGLCPQHNILFDNLTVEDHIFFYGLLKGMTREEIKFSLSEIVAEVGLTNKINYKSKNLSGGMKRKLSVAMAFIGDSKAIFLDEPTAGVDPYARRGIWDLLMRYRCPEKAIILTTHHMDEADYLSDRIAIISQGKLKCCGSSLFLKRQYGDGYYLILVKDSNAQKDEFSDSEHSESGKKIFKEILRFVDRARFIDETKTQWTFILPLGGLGGSQFPKLFLFLDESLSTLKIQTYGLSDTSLEEVFLKVADDPSQKVEILDENKLNLGFLKRLTGRTILPNSKIGKNPIEKSEFTKDEKNEPVVEAVNTKLLTGLSLTWQQILGLQIKRYHYTKRNIKGFFAELILPILMVTMIIVLVKMSNPFDSNPLMTIHPWLMMPKSRGSILNTFYRKENGTYATMEALTALYRSDIGESGTRCMKKKVYSLKGYECYSSVGNTWSDGPKTAIPQRTPACDCKDTEIQICRNPLSGGPKDSERLMASSDLVHNLNGYNISDHLMKKFDKYAQKQYGGFQFLLVSGYGITSKFIGESVIWEDLRKNIKKHKPNDGSFRFVEYFVDFFKRSGLRTHCARIWVDNRGYVAMPAYVNILSNMLLRYSLSTRKDVDKFGIVVNTHPFKHSNRDMVSMIKRKMAAEVNLSNFVILALSLIPASFVLFLIEERVSGSKRQQFVSGVNPYIYWISNFLWDIVKYLISALLIVIVFYIFDYQSFIGFKNATAFITLLCCYGFAIIPHMYPFSFFMKTPSTSFVVLSAYNMLVGSITTIMTFFLDQLEKRETSLVSINTSLKKFFLIFPQYGLGRGMMDLSSHYMEYNISKGQKTYDAFSWKITVQKLFAFLLLFIFWSAVIVVIESGIIHRRLLGKIKNYQLKDEENKMAEDIDVAKEKERVALDNSNENVLKVLNLTKIYNAGLGCDVYCFKKKIKKYLDEEQRKLAVNNISFGVKSGECFGLLGVNGAGKTTTFKMLTGEELITRGDAAINGKSITENMVGAHRNMGFCPQFDALHPLLTCEEELYFYCRIRGVEASKIPSTVNSNLVSLSLSPHTTKTTQTLSGGNKRKLSTAIALIGRPKVIFLDEPTSGMDAGARRFLWNRIQKLTNEEKAVILTSHNMEECEVLCHRLAIMVNGEFQCLGSVQELKSKFGNDYYIIIRMHPDSIANGDRDRFKQIMDENFKYGSYLKDENFVTVQYRVDPVSYRLNVIFEFFEKLKHNKLIMDYSVCQTTLDEVFISFAQKVAFKRILSSTYSRNISALL